MKRRIRPLLAILLVPGTLFAGLFGTSGTALAGQNGQQLRVCWTTSVVHHYYLEGNNQDGKWKVAPSTPLYNYHDKSNCGENSGWWWKGNVTVHIFDKASREIDQQTIYVPKEAWTDVQIQYN